MKSKFKKLALVLSLFAIIGLINPLQAQTQQTPKSTQDEIEFGCRMTKFIPNLTKEQEAKINNLHTTLMKTMLPLKNELAEKQARLNTLTTANPVDMKAVNVCIDEIQAIKTKMMKARIQFQQDVRALLSEEQRIQFDMHHSNMQGKHKGPGKGHGPKGKGCKSVCNGQGPCR